MTRTKDQYFMISNSDGDTYVRIMSKKQVLQEIKEKDGHFETIDSRVKLEHDTNYWGGKTLIIKGQIVTPFDKQTVVEYDIE